MAGTIKLDGTQFLEKVNNEFKITNSELKLKSSGNTIVDSSGNAVVSESGGNVTLGDVRLPASGGIKDSSGNNILTESGGTITLTADQANVGSNALIVDSSGNVGVGTSSPASKFYVSNTSSDVSATANSRNPIASFSGGNANNRLDVYVDNSGGTSTMGLGAYNLAGGSTELGFYTGGSVTERMRIDSSGNLKFDSGFGSVSTVYGCRAWVNFRGTSSVAIRGSGNVTSVSDYGSGDYQVNFATSMSDANYSTLITNTSFATNSTQRNSGIKGTGSSSVTTYSASSVRMIVGNPSSASLEDNFMMCVAVFR